MFRENIATASQNYSLYVFQIRKGQNQIDHIAG
jgi:hypothetical protein